MKKTTRRSFLKKTALGTAALSTTAMMPISSLLKEKEPLGMPRISLAQWSLHRAFEKGNLKAGDFASIAKNDFDLDAIEYVNTFYTAEAENEVFWNQMRNRAVEEGVQSILIMVDNEGLLGDSDSTKRKKAVENHYKWIHAAKILGCHSIRINAFGNGQRWELHAALADGLGALAEYGAQEGIHVLIENHGLHTSDADFIIGILKRVNNPYLGTLPDFGNWCLSAEWGSTGNKNCSQIYDPVKGVSKFLPYAKGVSAKSYRFDTDGFDSVVDYPALLKLVKVAGYTGYIGIEYEGSDLSEEAGIRATKALINKVWKSLD